LDRLCQEEKLLLVHTVQGLELLAKVALQRGTIADVRAVFVLEALELLMLG